MGSNTKIDSANGDDGEGISSPSIKDECNGIELGCNRTRVAVFEANKERDFLVTREAFSQDHRFRRPSDCASGQIVRSRS